MNTSIRVAGRALAIILLTTGLSLVAVAQTPAEQEPAHEAQPRTPAELAAESDFVVAAQLEVYEYEKRRDVPVEGKTWFRVLVPYKVPSPSNRLRVVEQGFGDDKCYFDDADMWNELPRYLLFLIRENGEIRGHPDGCALPLLTTTDNRYAVRWPMENLVLDDEAQALIQTLQFQGPGATVDLRDLTSIRREARVEAEQLEPVEGGHRAEFRYTRGILLEDFRPLLGEQNLTRDRLQRGR